MFLSHLQEFLEREVAGHIKLRRPSDDDNALQHELISPTVSIGWPQAVLAGTEVRKRVPGIIIGFAGDVTDDGTTQLAPIELVLIVYSSGTIEHDASLSVDATGYQDLLNLMDLSVRAIRNADDLGKNMALAEPTLRYWPENEQYYDYWIGHIELTLEMAPGPRAAEGLLI